MRHFVFLVIVFSILSTGIFPSFGQEPPPITAGTDKSTYTNGDTIVISGSVKSVVEGTPLTIQVLDPDKNIVQIAQIDVAQDGKYTTTVFAAGQLWKKDGIYTVKVQYGLPNVVAETNFTFSSNTMTTFKLFEVEVDDEGTFDVEYIIKGGTLNNMAIDAKDLALIVSINATSDGEITLKIPRELIDAKTPSGDDDIFIILINESEVTAKQEASSDFRTLTIGFLEGDSDIMIIGTQIIPEFGAVAALILAVAIISIIAVSAKTRLRLMPKY